MVLTWAARPGIYHLVRTGMEAARTNGWRSSPRTSGRQAPTRPNVREPGPGRATGEAVPVVFKAFDLLYLDGKDLTGRPLAERRRLLDEVLVPNDAVQLSRGGTLGAADPGRQGGASPAHFCWPAPRGGQIVRRTIGRESLRRATSTKPCCCNIDRMPVK